jgi:hypothetical protein
MSSDDMYLYDLALLSTIQMLIFYLIKYILSVHMSSHKQNKCNLHGTRKYNTLDNLFSMCKVKVKGVLYLLTSGYLELRGQESMVTIILWLLKTSACRVSILTFGTFLSAGTNI